MPIRESSIFVSFGDNAPVGQITLQGMSLHISHGTLLASKYGVPVGTADPSGARFKIA
jgi:hypothetical protein